MVSDKKFQILFIILTVISLCSCSVKEHHTHSEIILINDSAEKASSITSSVKSAETTIETTETALEETIKTTPAVSSVHNNVYYTRTGKHYHYLDKCGIGTYYECTLDEAKQNGLTPCKKCVK